jgi:hypothetical protein
MALLNHLNQKQQKKRNPLNPHNYLFLCTHHSSQATGSKPKAQSGPLNFLLGITKLHYPRLQTIIIAIFLAIKVFPAAVGSR